MMNDNYLPYEKCFQITNDGYVPDEFYSAAYEQHKDEIILKSDVSYIDIDKIKTDCWAVTQEQWDEFYSKPLPNRKYFIRQFDKFINKCYIDEYGYVFKIKKCTFVQSRIIYNEDEQPHASYNIIFNVDRPIIIYPNGSLKGYTSKITAPTRNYEYYAHNLQYKNKKIKELTKQEFKSLVDLRLTISRQVKLMNKK